MASKKGPSQEFPGFRHYPATMAMAPCYPGLHLPGKRKGNCFTFSYGFSKSSEGFLFFLFFLRRQSLRCLMNTTKDDLAGKNGHA